MSLKDTLLEDMKSAMKEKDTIRKNTVQMTRAAILQVEKDDRVILDDEGVLEIIAREAKKRKSAMPEFEKSGRQDLIDNLTKEIDILMGYLPEQISEAELEEIIKSVVNEVGASSMQDIGKVMSAIIPKTKGRADGKLVNTLVRKVLQ